MVERWPSSEHRRASLVHSRAKGATRDVTDAPRWTCSKRRETPGFSPFLLLHLSLVRRPPLPSAVPTMSSLRHHRVIIASLFLPNTAVLGESTPSSPNESALGPLVPPSPSLLTPATPARAPLLSRPTGPLKSIVEDLRDKVSTRTRYLLCLAAPVVS